MNWRHGLTLALLVAFFVQLARAIWVFVEPVPHTGAVAPVANVDMAVLNRVDPFFSEGQTVIDTSTDTGGFSLFGVSADGNGGGSAIIGLQDGTQVAVAVGEEIASGAILKTVNPDHVIVALNGRFLRVGFPEIQVEQTRLVQEEPPAVDAEAAPQAALIDPAKLVAEAGLRPKMEGLSIKGLQVSASENATQLTAAGLQDGDIILSINGTALTSPQAMGMLRQRLSNANTAEISYERGGQRRMTSIRTR